MPRKQTIPDAGPLVRAQLFLTQRSLEAMKSRAARKNQTIAELLDTAFAGEGGYKVGPEKK